MRKTRLQTIEGLNDGVGVTHSRQGLPRRAQAFEVLSRRSETDLVEQFRQRLDFLDALATLMRIVVAGVVVK
jgi:hypothetical protein